MEDNDPTMMRLIVGYIARKRSLGKNLAFADIQVEVESNDYNDNEKKSSDGTKTVKKLEIVKVIFQRDSSVWDTKFDDTFPTKSSALPHGAKVSMYIQRRNGDREGYEVHSWKMLENPREMALKAASSEGADGISCTLYLKERGSAYLRYNGDNNKTKFHNNSEKPVNKISNVLENKNNTEPPKVATNDNNDNDNNIINNQQFSHGDNRAKALRAKLFAQWLIDTFGIEYLTKDSGVLDIAGGKGKLSVELAVHGNIQSTIIDPLLRKRGKNLLPKEVKRIQKAQGPIPNHIAKPFNQVEFVQNSKDLLAHASLLVGIHPDECTEDILDVALQLDKSFAIVPCCVFPCLFPARILESGRHVQTYEQFLQYLLEKDDRLIMETLPFEGRNKVIYYKNSSC